MMTLYKSDALNRLPVILLNGVNLDLIKLMRYMHTNFTIYICHTINSPWLTRKTTVTRTNVTNYTHCLVLLVLCHWPWWQEGCCQSWGLERGMGQWMTYGCISDCFPYFQSWNSFFRFMNTMNLMLL